MVNLKRLLIKTLVALALCLTVENGFSQLYNEEAFKLVKTLEWVNNYYVDTANEHKLTEAAIVEIMKNLDPHSTYISKEEVKEMNEPLQGNFEGIGVSFNIMNDTILVVEPIAGGPSEKLGIRAGDRIITIDGKNVAGVGIKNSDVFAKLRGRKGTKVVVGIKRRNVPGILEFNITRDKIPIYSIDATYMIDGRTGYIKLNRFSFTTLNEFAQSLAKLKAQKAENLILDLCGNGGGYLDVAISLADQFLPDKKLILYTQGIHSPKTEYFSTAAGNFEKGKLIILVDEGSASASEIVSGAIQDWDRGLIIGRRSFGKGLVQRPFTFMDGSMLRLTIARYYTPTGRLIQKPYDKGIEDYSHDLIKRYNNGELSNEDSIHFPESQKFYTMINKRVVYGGGGIMPDYFVPLDTTGYSDYYRDLIAKGIFNQFMLGYTDNHREELKSLFPDFKDFDKKFVVTDSLLKQLTDYAVKEKLPLNEKELSLSDFKLRLLMKAYVARDIYTSSEFYQVLNQDEPIVKKAVEVLENDDLYQKKLLKR